MPCKKLAVLNFKIFHKCISNGYDVHKWNLNVDEKCIFCVDEHHTIKHMCFDCKKIKEMWTKLEVILKFKLRWKHIVLGFSEICNITYIRNLVIAIVIFTFYSKWVTFSESPNQLKHVNFKTSVLYYMNFYKKVMEKISGYKNITKTLQHIIDELK